MGRKKESGLRKRNGIWHIEKTVFGTRLYKSTNTSDRREAEKFLAHEVEKLRLTQLYGVRPKRTFQEAAEKYLAENQHKRSIDDDARQVALLKPYIGQCELDKVNMFVLQPFITERQQQKVKNRTINYSLQVVRRILKLASQEWMDESNLTWLSGAPKIKLLPLDDQREPHPIAGRNRIDCSRCCPYIYAVWRYLRLIPDYAIRKCVVYSGIGSDPSPD